MYQSTTCARSFRRQYTLPSTVHGFSAPWVKLSSVSLGTSPPLSTAANACLPLVLWLAHAASLFCVENTTSGQPLFERSNSWIFVRNELEPFAEPS